MKEESKALAPVYLLSLYGKWEKLDMIETMKKFVEDSYFYPKNQLSVIIVIVVYFACIIGIVRFLRKDFKKNH